MFRFPFASYKTSRILALAAFLGSAGLIGVAAQPPREEADPNAKVVKKVIVDDDGTVRKKVIDDDPSPGKKGVDTVPGTPPDIRLDELAAAAAAARTKALQDTFNKYVVPFDRLNEAGVLLRVKPIPLRKSADWDKVKTIQMTPLDPSGKSKEARAVKVSDIRDVVPFEKVVQEEADRLQKQKIEGVAPAEALAAAEKVMLAALRFHDYSRQERKVDGKSVNLRRGAGWDEIRTGLLDRLRGAQLEFLQVLAAANDTAQLRELTRRMLAVHGNNAEVGKAVAAVQVAQAKRLFESGTDQNFIAARKLLDELPAGLGGDAARDLRAELHKLAVKALDRAREKKEVGDDRTAREELARAAALEPDLDGLRDMQRKLQLDYPVLYVGVRQYPLNMSPVTAMLDSEKQAVELMFESLLEEVPNESGAVEYRPGAALTMPLAFPGGRDCLLRAIDQDQLGRLYFDSHDVVGTVAMLRNFPETWAAYPLKWLSANPPAPRDSAFVRIEFGLPHPDPRTALTFKIVPSRWQTANGRSIADGRFAESPFGTGPFNLRSNPRPDGTNNPREMVFVNNPLYGKFPDRNGLPNLREVRFVEATKIDPIKAFQEGKLHILPDIPTSEIAKYTKADGPDSLRSKVDVVTSANNRRIYMLAINLKYRPLQNKDLRQGLSLAIDRDDILRKIFRDQNPAFLDFHRAMTGPFPPGTWAASQRGNIPPAPLFNDNLAVVKLKNYLTDQGAVKRLKLAFPSDDPLAERACDEIRKQIDRLLPGDNRISIEYDERMPLATLMRKVQVEHNYELAYIPFDYPDDWYPFALSGMLDPVAAVRNPTPAGALPVAGRNWFSFLVRDANPAEADQELGRALNKIQRYRDFTNELMPQANQITKLFNDSLPFIPLWQLDRHTVVSKRVKVYVDDSGEPANPRLLNPTILFQNVGRWRLE